MSNLTDVCIKNKQKLTAHIVIQYERSVNAYNFLTLSMVGGRQPFSPTVLIQIDSAVQKRQL